MPSEERRAGWASGTHSLILVFDGHLRDLITGARAEKALGGIADQSAMFEFGSPNEAVLHRYTNDGFGVRLELTAQNQTRLQVIHVAPPDSAAVTELSTILRRLLADPLPRPNVIGLNFARVYLDGQHFSPTKFMRELAAQSGLEQILGGQGVHELSDATLTRNIRNERVGQLKLRGVHGEAITGRFTGVLADVNFTIPVARKSDVRAATTKKEILKRHREFDRVMHRLEQRIANDD